MESIFLPKKLILGVPATTLTTVAAGTVGAGAGAAVVGAVVVLVIVAAGVVVTATAEVAGVAAVVPVAPGFE